MSDNELPQETSVSFDYAHPSDHHSGPYLVGPMVIRVYPDGRPVPSDAQRPPPRDEDIEDIRYTARLPSLQDLEATKKSSTSIVGAASSASVMQTEAVAAKAQQQPMMAAPRQELLPPRKSYRTQFYRLLAPPRFYSRLTPVGRPNGLLVRERFY